MGVRGAGVLIGADKTHFWKGCVPEVEGGGNCRCACGLPITLRNTPGSQRRPTLRQLCPHSTSGLWPLQGCGFVATAGVRLCGHCRGAAAIQWLLVLSLGNMSPWQPSTSFYLTPHPGAEMYFTPSQKDNCVSFVRKILSALGQHDDFPRPVAALTPTPGPAHVTEPRAS